MKKIKVKITYFGEGTENLEFSTEEAFEAFEKGWELGSLFTDENGACHHLRPEGSELGANSGEDRDRMSVAPFRPFDSSWS